MKAIFFTAIGLLIGFVSFASGDKSHLPLTAFTPHDAHTPWYLFGGIVLLAVFMSAITIAHAEPKDKKIEQNGSSR